MNRASSLFACTAISATVLFTSCSPSGKTSQQSSPVLKTEVAGTSAGARLAYVDIDSFETRYESLKKKKDEFKVKQGTMEAELQRSAEQMQADYAAVVRKQQAGTLTQSEGEAAQKRLGQMQESLETRRAAMSNQFQTQLETFNRTLHTEMDAFLADYTKAHNLDFVLSYSRSNAQILFAKKGYDITDDVVKGMNERAAKSGNATVK